MLLGCLACLTVAAHAKSVDVLVDLKGANETRAQVARVLGEMGRVMGQEGGAFRVELSGDVAQSIESLRKHRSVASVKPVAPVLPTNLLEVRKVSVLKTQIERYKRKYEVFEELTPGAKPQELGSGPRHEYPGLDYLESYLFYLEQRAYPFDQLDWKKWNEAGIHRDRMPTWGAGQPGPTGLGPAWTYLGPNNLGVPYQTYFGVGPVSGRINGIAISPTTPSTWYATGAQGGVFKTTNDGATWQALGDQWEVMAASAVAVHPTDPNTVYVGTGDYPGSRPYCMGIMKSTDGGVTWVNQGRTQLGARAINKILLDPNNPNTVIATQGRGAAGNGQVWRSTNGGNTWNVSISTFASWSDLSVGVPYSGSNRYIYAAGGDNSGCRLFRSSNGGASWVSLPSPVSGNQQGVSIAASKLNGSTVYLLCPSAQKIFKSTNAGSSWSDISLGFPGGDANVGFTYNWSQGYYDFFIETTVHNGQDLIYVGLIDLVVSPNGGLNWVSIGGPTYTGVAKIHNDQHAIAIHPSFADQAVVGGDGGVVRLQLDPTGFVASFTHHNSSLGAVQFYRAGQIPAGYDILMGGTQDNATPRTTLPNLATWSNVGGGDGGFCGVRSDDPTRQYATAQFLNIFQTTDSWLTQTNITPPYGSDQVSFIAPIEVGYSTVLAGTNYLWHYADVLGWTPRVGGQKLSSNGSILTIFTVGPFWNTYTGSSDGELWLALAPGPTWTRVDTGSPGLPNRAITSVSEISWYASGKVVVSVSGTGTGHVWYCDNIHAPVRVWENRSGSGSTALPDVPVNDLERSRGGDGVARWYAATDVGVFVTSDAGLHWYNATAPLGLPNTQVNDLALAGDELIAATFGRGMWKIPVNVLVPLSGTIELRGFIPTNVAKEVTLEFYLPGTTTLAGTVPVQVVGGGPQPFSVSVHLEGTYDVAARGPSWLRQRLSNVLITPFGAGGLVYSLFNGDANGDNRVDSDDFDILAAGFGGSGPLGDFDGVNGVDSDDFDILIQNFGLVGDN
ncbi:MAG TPA: hypothetical protein PLH94_06495 [Fimbriimonadaceae bacterium]|nr:hypothetical protein [Fimbriimonadaceae bacterium]